MTDDILKKVSQDERLRNLRESREIAQMEIDWGMQIAEQRGHEEGRKEGIEEGRKEGIEEGRKEGIEEGKKEGAREKQYEIARNLKNAGISNEQIAESTGLTVEEVKAL